MDVMGPRVIKRAAFDGWKTLPVQFFPRLPLHPWDSLVGELSVVGEEAGAQCKHSKWDSVRLQ